MSISLAPEVHIGLVCMASNVLSPRSGLVPLHNACSYGHYEVAETLVNHNANVNAVDLWKFTPLHEAAAKGKYEICKLLIKVCTVCSTCSVQRRHDTSTSIKAGL